MVLPTGEDTPCKEEQQTVTPIYPHITEPTIHSGLSELIQVKPSPGPVWLVILGLAAWAVPDAKSAGGAGTLSVFPKSSDLVTPGQVTVRQDGCCQPAAAGLGDRGRLPC